MIGNNDINAVYEHFSNITSSSDPFVDIWNGNGNLADYSFGIGSGALSQQLFSEKTVTSPLLDFYGNPRPLPNGSNPDMGALPKVFGQKNLPGFMFLRSGSDINSGNEESPFLTISKGVSASSNGDTVLVGGGIYYENIEANG